MRQTTLAVFTFILITISVNTTAKRNDNHRVYEIYAPDHSEIVNIKDAFDTSTHSHHCYDRLCRLSMTYSSGRHKIHSFTIRNKNNHNNYCQITIDETSPTWIPIIYADAPVFIDDGTYCSGNYQLDPSTTIQQLGLYNYSFTLIQLD